MNRFIRATAKTLFSYNYMTKTNIIQIFHKVFVINRCLIFFCNSLHNMWYIL